MVDHVTIRRWAAKPGAAEDAILDLVNEAIVPAWRQIPGCLSLNLLRVHGTSSYLAVTYWRSKDDLDRWSGSGGQAWRDDHRALLARWLELLTFQDEVDADLLVVG